MRQKTSFVVLVPASTKQTVAGEARNRIQRSLLRQKAPEAEFAPVRFREGVNVCVMIHEAEGLEAIRGKEGERGEVPCRMPVGLRAALRENVVYESTVENRSS